MLTCAFFFDYKRFPDIELTDLGHLVRNTRIVTFRSVKDVLCISKVKCSFEL